MKLIMAVLLVTLGVLFRTVWHLGPNVEFVTSATLLAGAYLGKKWAFIVPVSIMAISDLTLGNTNIFLFTWSAYLIIGLTGHQLLKDQKHPFGTFGKLSASKLRTSRLNIKNNKIFKAMGIGIGASAWFFLWTNFGVWLLDSWGMYPKTITGLIDAYIMGIPFLKYNLIGNLFLVPLSFLSVEILSSKLLPRRQAGKVRSFSLE